MQRTNIELDEKLVKQGLRITKLRTKKELVNYALSELVRRHKLRGLLKLHGKVQWDGDLNEMRRGRT